MKSGVARGNTFSVGQCTFKFGHPIPSVQLCGLCLGSKCKFIAYDDTNVKGHVAPNHPNESDTIVKIFLIIASTELTSVLWFSLASMSFSPFSAIFTLHDYFEMTEQG